MSIFRTLRSTCPACGAAVPTPVVLSVNADRRPDLREAILDNSFQMQRCPGCATEWRLEPQFHDLDQQRHTWVAAWPRGRLTEWEAAVEESRQAFDEAFGPASPAGAQAIGAELAWCVTFGWPALREKVLLAGSGLDPVLIEMVKLAGRIHASTGTTIGRSGHPRRCTGSRPSAPVTAQRTVATARGPALPVCL